MVGVCSFVGWRVGRVVNDALEVGVKIQDENRQEKTRNKVKYDA